MYVPIPALVAIVLVIAFLLFLLRRRRSGDMLEQQRREAGAHVPTARPKREPTRHDLQHLLEEPDIAAALAKGRKIEAIKLVRERSGLGLKEAKELVERG